MPGQLQSKPSSGRGERFAPARRRDACRALHRQPLGRTGDRRDVADDRSVGRTAFCDDRRRHGAGYRRCRPRRATRVDGAVGPARAGREGPACSRSLARAIDDHADELALIEARDCGKPLAQARNDVAACARYFEFYGGASDKLTGETIPYPASYTVLTWREPHGVTGHIIPWNYPLQIFGRSVGGALAAGNACVVKPAEDACLSLLRVAELAAEIGLARRGAQYRHGTWARGGRRARVASPASITCRSPARRRPAHGWPRSREAPLPGNAGAWRQGRARSCSRTPISTPRCRSSSTRSSRTPDRRAPRAAGSSSSARATRKCWRSSARASRR